MARFILVFVTVLTGVCLYSAIAESCTNFKTTTTVSADSATLKFSLPDTCIKEHRLRFVSVAAAGVVNDICLIVASSWSLAPVGECKLDQTSHEYSLTRSLGATKRTENIILTAEFFDRGRITTNVLLELPDNTTPPSVTAAYVTIADDSQTQPSQNRGTTDESAESLKPPSNGPTDTGAGEHDDKEDIPSFTQTPAFYGFVMVGVVMAIMMILLVVLLVRQKGIPALARRRARNSMVIPDNYEHPARGSHHYERPCPTHRRGRQEPLPPPPPPSNPVVHRDSLPDPNYDVLDGGYEVPRIVVPRVPVAGVSTQADSSL